MKKPISLLLLFSLILALTSCKDKETKEVTCEQIVSVYEDAGYHVSHGEHKEDSPYCHISVTVTGSASDESFIYFDLYDTEEEACCAAEDYEYHLVKWIFALPLGEARWLKSKSYGNIHYHYYDNKMDDPFMELIKE